MSIGLGDIISHYVLVNFTTFRTIIDAIGGVDVDNPYAFGFFDDSSIWFEQGNIHLDGDNALYYVRERYTLPDGDFGRTMHQQIVMKAIIAKLTSSAVITKFDSLLTALKGTFLTNISDSAIYSLCQMQLDQNISWNVVNYHILGTTGTSVCASSGSTPLSVVMPYSNQVSFVSSEIDKVEAGETITQQDLPDGYGTLVEPVGSSSSENYENEYSQQNETTNQNQYQEQQGSQQTNNYSGNSQSSSSQNSSGPESAPTSDTTPVQPETPTQPDNSGSQDGGQSQDNNSSDSSGTDSTSSDAG